MSKAHSKLLPVERRYHDMLKALGFTNLEVRTIRKRNSKKELFEFDVTVSYSGYIKIAGYNGFC